MELDPIKVSHLFDLGEPLQQLQAISGGLSHRVWKLHTTSGMYAIKEMNRFWDEPNWLTWLEQAWGFEQRALAADVLMPEPVVNPQTGSCLAEIPRDGERPFTVRVHKWIEADIVESFKPVDPIVAKKVGTTLALLHEMNDTNFMPEMAPGLKIHGFDEWNILSNKVAKLDIIWANELSDALTLIAEAETLVNSAAQFPSTYLLTHGDIDQKNLLRSQDNVFVIDWDVCNAMPPRDELVRCAYDLAGWATGNPDLDIRDTLLDSYVQAGGAFDSIKPQDFASAFKAHLDWIWFNIERSMGNYIQSEIDRQLAIQLVPADLLQLRHMLNTVEHI